MKLIQLLMWALLIFIGVRAIRNFLRQGAPAQQRRAPERPRASSPPTSAYEVLGVQPQATQEEIRAAYQRLIQQYHPDRVADMGPELRQVAEQRTKEINEAYTLLKQRPQQRSR